MRNQAYHALGDTAEKWHSWGMTPARDCGLILVFGTWFCVAGLWAIPARNAHAADRQKQDPLAGAPLPAGYAKRFQTGDQAELLMVLDELKPGQPDASRAVRAVCELLMAGQSDVVTDHALDGLARIGAREARDTLLVFTEHRRASARMRAYTALAHLKDPSLAAQVALGLRDSAAEVRAAAAAGVAELHSSQATDSLLLALERGLSEAAPALGQVGDAASVARFSAYLGKQPLDVMLSGYANYLQREDLPESAKLSIVASLEDVSGAVVKSFLQEQLAMPGRARGPKLQRAMELVVARIKVAGASNVGSAP
jgi:hypothetical protein